MITDPLSRRYAVSRCGYAGARGAAVVIYDPDEAGGFPEWAQIGCVKETLAHGNFIEGTILLQGGLKKRVWGVGPGQRLVVCR